MSGRSWTDLMVPKPSDEDGVWELFHANSKVYRHSHFLPDDVVADRMSRMAVALDYEGRPLIPLPTDLANLSAPLSRAVVGRVTPKRIAPAPVSIEALASILFAGCGVTRANKTTSFLRPFRAAPSGGGLFPLELYIFTKHVPGIAAGLYHFSPPDQALRQLRAGDLSIDIAQSFVEFQTHLAYDASLIVMVTAMFQRSTFKYGARGYRFIFLEAGHVAQNINLACTALGLGCFNIGGFYDQAVDRFLGIDGLNHGTIYMMAIGELAECHEPPQPPTLSA
jgi:SagB-type dehydrogenase family enzyme